MALAGALSQQKPFYGWYIVGLALVAQFMMAADSFTATVFLKPVVAELGWTRTMFSAAQSLGTLFLGFLALFIGGIIDRRGGRGMMVLGGGLLGLGFVALSQLQSLWQLYIIRSLIITVGLLLMGHLVVNVAVSNWFIRHRGRAIAIGGLGGPLGGMALVPLAQAIVDGAGWRTAWVVLGIMAWVLVVPASFLFMRRRPEDVGLRPDGDGLGSQPGDSPPSLALPSEVTWTRRQAMATPTLWLLAVGFGIASFGISTLMLHFLPFLTDSGYPPMVAATMRSLGMIPNVVAKPLWGLLVERVAARWVAMAAFLLNATAVVLFLSSREPAFIWAGLAFWGLGTAGMLPAQEVVWANYYGRLTLGTVRSIGMPFVTIASAAGPLVGGLLFDATGSYLLPFAGIALGFVVAAGFILLAKPPQQRPAPVG